MTDRWLTRWLCLIGWYHWCPTANVGPGLTIHILDNKLSCRWCPKTKYFKRKL